jgi:SAM-dependent methyltransferase
MKQNVEYVLATGEAATTRLRVLHNLYGPGARRVLLQAGLERGMRVADLGCGVGMTTGLLADLVGPTGHVVGVDASGAQIAEARTLLPPGRSNVSFIEASATCTGLPTKRSISSTVASSCFTWASPSGPSRRCTACSGGTGSWSARTAT